VARGWIPALGANFEISKVQFALKSLSAGLKLAGFTPSYINLLLPQRSASCFKPSKQLSETQIVKTLTAIALLQGPYSTL
jgi:hypothetical protein